jgi:hypothetical protein
MRKRKGKHVRYFERKIHFALPIVRYFDVLSDEKVKVGKAPFANQLPYPLEKESSVFVE